MAHKALREYDGQRVLAKLIEKISQPTIKLNDHYVQITETTDLSRTEKDNLWLKTEKLVVKVDQLIKRRGKNSLVLLNATWDEAKQWIKERMGKELTIDGITGVMGTFLITPFIAHEKRDEYYFAIRSLREHDEILFHHAGGVDVGDVDSVAKKLAVGVWADEQVNEQGITEVLLGNVPEERREAIAQFIVAAFNMYVHSGFVYLEINPLVYVDGKVLPLDLAVKLDDTAAFEHGVLWGEIEFPAPFGRLATKEENFVARLDANTGASLKLTILNAKARIWSLVAGGGASVIYADTIADLGFGHELANYGEYSGNPSDDETFEYTKTVLDLMTREKDPEGREKILLIGGGIANFTDVAKTFNGIVRALKQYADELKAVKTRIYVRRGGPNYKEGLENLRRTGAEIGIPIDVYGPETHMTKIVKLALAA